MISDEKARRILKELDGEKGEDGLTMAYHILLYILDREGVGKLNDKLIVIEGEHIRLEVGVYELEPPEIIH